MVHTDTVEYSAPVTNEGVLYVWEWMYLSVLDTELSRRVESTH